MPLTLESLLWVLPGICFIFAYNRLRDVETVEFSGWPYVFFIVLVGVVTVLPIKWLLGESVTSGELSFNVVALSSLAGFSIPFIIKWCFIPLVHKLDQEPNFFIPSNLWSIVYFFFPLENRDKFIKHCIDHEGEAFLITVEEPIIHFKKLNPGNSTNDNKQQKQSSDNTQNDNKDLCNTHLHIPTQVYLGILLEFPYVATNSIESQVIRILPLLAGYKYVVSEKNRETEKIKWITKYEVTEDSEGIIIPRNKIIHFCLYDEDLHKNLVFNSH